MIRLRKKRENGEPDYKWRAGSPDVVGVLNCKKHRLSENTIYIWSEEIQESAYEHPESYRYGYNGNHLFIIGIVTPDQDAGNDNLLDTFLSETLSATDIKQDPHNKQERLVKLCGTYCHFMLTNGEFPDKENEGTVGYLTQEETLSKRYYIEDINYGVSEGGIACSPPTGSINASIKFTVNGETKWFTISELNNIPSFFLTDRDIFKQLSNNDLSDEFTSYLEENAIFDFDGLLLGEYEDIFLSFTENPGNPAIKLVRLLILLVKCKMDEVFKLITLACDKYIDEINVPVSSLEEDWLIEMSEVGEDDEVE